MASLFRYDAVVFADVDLELMPIAQHEPHWVGAVWARALSQIAHHPRLKLLADPDRYSPINGGFMLLQPSADLYEQGIHTLRRCARPPFATPAPKGRSHQGLSHQGTLHTGHEATSEPCASPPLQPPYRCTPVWKVPLQRDSRLGPVGNRAGRGHRAHEQLPKGTPAMGLWGRGHRARIHLLHVLRASPCGRIRLARSGDAPSLAPLVGPSDEALGLRSAGHRLHAGRFCSGNGL